MSQQTLRVIAALLAAVIVGCGGSQTPKAEKPAEPEFTAAVRTTEAVTVAAIAKTGPYDQVAAAFADLQKWAADAKVALAGPPMGFYYDDPAQVKPESLRSEACLPVPAGTKADPKSGIVIKELTPMMLATTMHTGAPDNVQETYGKLRQWIADNGYQIAGPGVEFYHSPQGTPAESTKIEIGFVVAQKPAAEAQPAEGSGK